MHRLITEVRTDLVLRKEARLVSGYPGKVKKKKKKVVILSVLCCQEFIAKIAVKTQILLEKCVP